MKTISDRAFVHRLQSGFFTEAEFAAPILKLETITNWIQCEQVFLYQAEVLIFSRRQSKLSGIA